MKKLWKMDKFQKQLILKHYFDKPQIMRMWKKCRYDTKLLKGKELIPEIMNYMKVKTLLGEKMQTYLDSRFLDAHDNSQSELWSSLRHSEKGWETAEFISQLIRNTEKRDKQIELLNKKIEKLNEDLKNHKNYSRELKKTNKKLETKFCRIEKQSNNVEKTIKARRNNDLKDEVIKKQKDEILKLNYKLEARNSAYKRLQNKYRELFQKDYLHSSNPEKEQFKIPELIFNEKECLDCDDYKICYRNILLVGGLERLSSSYKDEVEKLGGNFKYHNGRSSGDNGKLSSKIYWADLVLCPVNVNSHNACLAVKNMCKKMGKQYMMLPSAGLSSISKSLLEHSSKAN